MSGKLLQAVTITVGMILCAVTSIEAYDDKQTHPDITEKAIKESNINNFFIKNLEIESGIDKEIQYNGEKKKILLWIKSGSTKEDLEVCRRSNHFHNPVNPNWQYAGMDELPSWVCDSWHPLNLGQAYSALTWATGYITQPPLNPSPDTPDGLKAAFSSDPDKQSQNWDKAREYFYNALTQTFPADRDSYLARTFQTLGQVLHLLQDMGVPAHVRNDFLNSHIYTGGANPYESYVKANPLLVSSLTSSAVVFPNLSTPRITDFWDTNQTPLVVTDTSLQDKAGLSEYTNANFLSEGTLFTNSNVFSYPSPTTSVQEVTVNIADPFVSGWTVSRTYYKKVADWDSGYLLAGKGYLDLYYGAATGQPDVKIPPMDDYVHKDYADHILPRAVGYSAALLDYFFRGDIQLSLPDTGVYAQSSGLYAGFSTLSVMAQNTSSTGEEMTDGEIKLVVRYLEALQNPFEFSPVRKSSFYSYIVASEATNKRIISRGTPTLLTFNLDTTLPWDATDATIQVVYHGRLGNEDGAVVVGNKDISEPTPVDILDDMNMICINQAWYTAGSQEAITAVDTDPYIGNNNGIADEWDVYPHDVEIYIRFSPESNPNPPSASPTDYNFHVSRIYANPDGNLSRIPVILTDYSYRYSVYFMVYPTDTNDYWTHFPWASLLHGTAIKNQTEYTTDPVICQNDIDHEPPCYNDISPAYCTYRNHTVWWGSGAVVSNLSYPYNTVCSYVGVSSCPVY